MMSYISRREMLLIMLRSPIITWTVVGLYMNGEPTHSDTIMRFRYEVSNA